MKLDVCTLRYFLYLTIMLSRRSDRSVSQSITQSDAHVLDVVVQAGRAALPARGSCSLDQLPACVLGLKVFLHSSSHNISVFMALWPRDYMAPTRPFFLERSVACIAIPPVLILVVVVPDLGLQIPL